MIRYAVAFMKIGIAGLGRMGMAMARRLVDTGHEVVAWNRTPCTLIDVKMTATPTSLVQQSDTVISCVFDGSAVRSVYLGSDGFCGSSLRNKLFIDTSTVAPQVSREVAVAVEARGGSFVDSPVLGTLGPCSRGELIAMVGGTRPAFEAAATSLASLTCAVHYMGPVGSGAAAKLAVNLVMGSYWAAMGDALTLAAEYSLNRGQLLDIIGSGPAALTQLPMKRPVLDGQELRVDFNVSGYMKDLTTMLEAAGPAVNLPVVDGMVANYREAINAGWGDRDVVSVALRGAYRARIRRIDDETSQPLG